jgi:hypothetical protein
MTSVLEFWREYERLSELGACDGPGGMEYRRVLADWLRAGQPPWIEEFIRRGANRMAGVLEPPTPPRMKHRETGRAVKNNNDMLDLERGERLLELRKARIEKDLPIDGRDLAPGGAGSWVEYAVVVTALATVRAYLRPPTTDKRRRPDD